MTEVSFTTKISGSFLIKIIDLGEERLECSGESLAAVITVVFALLTKRPYDMPANDSWHREWEILEFSSEQRRLVVKRIR